MNFIHVNRYEPINDAITDSSVSAHEEWQVDVHNWPDATGDALSDVSLKLEADELFGHLGQITGVIESTENPYRWSFPIIEEGHEAAAFAGRNDVSFDLGFTGSRTVNRRFFDEAGEQLITITIDTEEAGHYGMGVALDNPAVTTTLRAVKPDGVEADYNSDTGWLNIGLPNGGELESGESFTVFVELEVFPPAGQACKYVPGAAINLEEHVGVTYRTGSSGSYDNGAGTWTWNSANENRWEVAEAFRRGAYRSGVFDRYHPPELKAVAVDPGTLWPPNNKEREVSVFVEASDQDGDLAEVVIEVDDEYDEYDVVVTRTVNGGDLRGSYVIDLEAARDGRDRDGRTYAITVTVEDEAGLSDTRTATVLVPHDQ